ncbi:hypothetical protein MKEN_01438600 [Mycena kentingensis (nom. inval.)]|nr:hypothetical protein MKEN_01438600 [Mycena kentingensis (nom. inval.)]
MTDNPSGAGPSKAIASLAKKPSDLTRQGTQKLKFAPVLPGKRVKKEEVKPEPAAAPIPSPTRGRGRGRGRGAPGDGRGRGRGAAPRAPVEMTASGPFAMGPAMAGNNARRSVPRSNFSAPVPTVDRASLGAGLTRIGPPPVKREAVDGKGKVKVEDDDDAEVYSEPDEGVEIVDMEDVKQMDWMAPESLRRERRSAKKKKKHLAKKEEDGMDVAADAAATEVDAANALDLSESEEEEEYEDLIEHFAQREEDTLDDAALREERLYFFQFPTPFPTFTSTAPAEPVPEPAPEPGQPPAKKVTFADGVKAGSATPSAAPDTPAEKPSTLDGIIGDLEVYRSGAVKMRLQNGMLLDVTAATQPSFLQHAVCLDIPQKTMTILGEVNKRFVVSPDIETLLTAMEVAERRATEEKEQQMDTT